MSVIKYKFVCIFTSAGVVKVVVQLFPSILIILKLSAYDLQDSLIFLWFLLSSTVDLGFGWRDLLDATRHWSTLVHSVVGVKGH